MAARTLRMLRIFLLLLVSAGVALASPPHAANTVLERSPLVNGTQPLLSGNHTTKRRRKRRTAAAALPETVKQPGAQATRITETPKKQAKGTEKKRKLESSGGREAACLRRIKREWKDAVNLGIAYDWTKKKTIQSSKTDLEQDNKYSYVRIGPFGKNLLRWHFSVMGTPNSDYEGGIYHGRVLLPKDYPSSPPRIQVLTPSGRFVVGADICLSASAYHPESWTPRWTILSLVDALRLHMLMTANEIGGKDASPKERRRLARASRLWKSGSVDHARMVRDGIFPYQDEQEQVGERHVQQHESGVQLAVKQTPPQEVRVRKRVPSVIKIVSVLIRAVIKVVTSPVRLALLTLLTLMVILNRR